jgi:hypothetical protein
VIAYLKRLRGIPPTEALPSGTAIVSEILRLEDLQTTRPRAVASPRGWEPAGYRGNAPLYN